MPKKETREQFFQRNAAKGNSARITVKLDLRHIPADKLKELGMSALEIVITDRTLTPEQALKIRNVLLEVM